MRNGCCANATLHSDAAASATQNFRAFITSFLDLQAVEICGGIVKERRLLGGGSARSDALEGVPHHRVAEHPLVDREIALEHAALRAEQLDRGLHERAPRSG